MVNHTLHGVTLSSNRPDFQRDYDPYGVAACPCPLRLVPIDLIFKGIMTLTSVFCNVDKFRPRSNRPDFQRDYDTLQGCFRYC